MRSILAFGVSSLIVQLALFREFLSVVSPNELTISLLLCAWLSLSGLGAFIGGRVSFFARPGFRGLHALAALLPLVVAAALRCTRSLVFGPGVQPGPLQFFAFAGVLLAAVCIVNGVFMAAAWRTLQPSGRQSLYAIDAVGNILGGLVFSLLLFRVPDVFITLAAAGMFHVWAMHVPGKIKKMEIAVCGLCLLFPALNMNTRTLAHLYKGFAVIAQENSPYGAVRILSKNNEEYVVQNTGFTGYKNNTGVSEECAHLCLLQVTAPRAILVVSGALSGTIAEVQKYAPLRVDYIDPDPVLLSLAKQKGMVLPGPGMHAIAGDARKLIESSNHLYDAIIVQLPPPLTLGNNRFYTDEFFAAVNHTLAKKGVFALALPPIAASMGPETAARFSMIKATLQRHFSHVVFFPGLATVALAANRPLDTNAVALLQARALA
ncbi:MAG: hypothetical protein A2487_16065 [Candidatus Raymondbacteria bacterium RifOxyC12_full_50_8]|uniref:PABS domain-containing protein n=1 Tax=Candidatus Raymondbacteria bacterium RIFOXYD12_FULL_49_13 TaxID=1817890 RepID=A0A1F7FEW4_UNCRA|nr:MAG: hypothetical protein A2248_10265 [Candidatus Raymondbacteria bacterium RIFOXYA2_FULL_49_16]OGJ99624.1 MAG: hypothetical protein A2487_16065 [Candidatus Raymondbacteria bacterium RifOxyC12_full_50_8]OGK05240.1 MAG: hypothetical protein A2519_10420 [Candidatus Raymondbacteria bacterium RIFOXYD12_FULL_49_13]OGP43023.1 MAG: hypothetical protein A2324_14950 [Candidatus Raymondbacteria bacterium RIFOXYB2_FULL_49_35]